MTKINLLPPEKIRVRRKPAERSFLWLVIALPLLVVIVLALLYFQANGKVSQKEQQLKQAQQDLTDIQNKNAALQQYKTQQDKVTQLQNSVVTVLKGRVFWARILNNIAINCPTDIWLTQLSGTSEATTGRVTFAGYALQCPNRDNLTRFYPYFPDYKPIANWLERMSQIVEFQSVWLSSAVPARQGSEPNDINGWTFQTTTNPAPKSIDLVGERVIQFNSTATLNLATAAIGGAPAAPATTPAAPAPSTTEGSTP